MDNIKIKIMLSEENSALLRALPVPLFENFNVVYTASLEVFANSVTSKMLELYVCAIRTKEGAQNEKTI